MPWRVFLARVGEALRRRRLDHDLNEELDTHLSLLEDEYARRGLSRAEVRRAARLDLGGLDQTKEAVRDRRGFRMLETLVQDARYAVRLLVKAPGFTTAAIVTQKVRIRSAAIRTPAISRTPLTGLLTLRGSDPQISL